MGGEKKAGKSARSRSQIATSRSAGEADAGTALTAPVEQAILSLRGQRVMLDETLAGLYGVPVGRLNEQVKRNPTRFPEDFMFRLTQDEADILRSQFAASRSPGHGGRRYLPYAFTEQGVAMLSSVLRSERAVAVNIEIMRTFVKLRDMLAEHAELSRKLDRIEKKYDAQFRVVFDVIRELMTPPSKTKRPIGFGRKA